MDHSPRFLKLAEDARARITEISIDEISARLARGDDFTLLDVREDHELAEKGRLPGARHLGRGILERDIETLLPDPLADIVVYCGGGFRSALAAESLQKMGYENVRSMAGGFRGWLERGLGLDPTKR